MRLLLIASMTLLTLLPGPDIRAEGSAWLPEPQSGYASLSYVYQTADDFYRAETKRPTPAGGEDLSQGTVWLTVNYAFADNFAVDLQAGWAKSDFTTGPTIPTPEASFNGLTDVNVGVTWRIVDEALSDLPSIALRGAAIIAGDYETGYINSLGDGGDGFSLSAIFARFLGDRFGVSAEVGYRDRNNGVPADYFVNLSSLFLVTERVSLGLDYSLVDSRSGLDIGEPAFSPDRFPELEEDTETVSARLYYNFGEVGMNVFYGKVIDGRNTAASDIFGVTVSYLFDTF